LAVMLMNMHIVQSPLLLQVLWPDVVRRHGSNNMLCLIPWSGLGVDVVILKHIHVWQ